MAAASALRRGELCVMVSAASRPRPHGQAGPGGGGAWWECWTWVHLHRNQFSSLLLQRFALSATSQVALAPKAGHQKTRSKRTLSTEDGPPASKTPQWATSPFHSLCPQCPTIFCSSLWCKLQASVCVIRFKQPGQQHASPAHLPAGRAIAECLLYLRFSFQLLSSSFQGQWH